MAKKYDNLYGELTSFTNLYWAFRKAAKGKRGNAAVAAFEFNLEEHLIQIQQELIAQSYTPGEYYSFYIRDPKHRLISAAPFHDRVVHHALCQVIEPIFERTFIGDSYANRVGKGSHKALDKAQAWAKHYPYVLQCDLRQFFPSVDHAILRQEISRKIIDENVRWLCDSIMQSGEKILRDEYEMIYFAGDNLLAINRPRGLPIGNLTSQFWANVYMNPFDHFVKRELHCKAYLRYVDDFLLFAEDKKTLNQWKQAIGSRLARMRLTIHPHAQARPVTEGFTFLGFCIFPQKRRLKRQKRLYYQRKLREMASAYGSGDISLTEMDASVQGWVNHVRYGNTIGLRKAILGSFLLGGKHGT
ncbi:MAG: RNA-dependent DNA polymerase [Anaerolineae bacterium]|nr:RNA-dependent DNA polymerase [Anaerolineae bacterium]